MTRLLRSRNALGGSIAAVLVVASIALVVPLDDARAQTPGLVGELPSGGGIALATWQGGHADALLEAARARDCDARSFWASRPGGGLVGYFPTAITIVNREFLEAHPGGEVAGGTPVIVVCASGVTAGGPVQLVPALGGRNFDRPVELVAYPGGRWLLADQGGRVTLLSNAGAELGVFLDLAVSRGGNEEGLLSIALDPGFPTRPYLYAYYSAPSGPRQTRLSRFTVANDAASTGSELRILAQDQPYANHNGGAVRFGPDGMLYLGLGDGGSGGDPQGNGQNRGTLLGSVIRIDVSSATASAPYAIPADNPFVGVAGARGEIWAYGLRNPWRMAFDPTTGELWLGDVGQSDVEEIDVIRRGGNYGWNRLEGRDCYEPRSGCSSAGTVLPVATYRHDEGCSVTGGVAYRGSAVPQLAGHYVYGDYCSGRIWSLPVGGGTPVEVARAGSVSSFAVGPDGEVYVLQFGGPVLRVAP